jgi:hypothetical protein
LNDSARHLPSTGRRISGFDRAFTPDLTAEDPVEPADVGRFSFRGLILLQLGKERNGRRGESRLTIVDRIRHEATGEELRATDYLRIFERLRRSMRKRLVVSRWWCANGAPWLGGDRGAGTALMGAAVPPFGRGAAASRVALPQPRGN